MDATQKEIELIQQVGQYIDGQLVDELVKQGHHLTGALEASIGGTVINNGAQTSIKGYTAGYGVFVNRGVMAANVPFNEGSGAGTSKYITALTNYWKLRGLSEKQAIRAAFATAKKQKKEGMPTGGSYAFSSTGERKNFIDIVAERDLPEINDKVVSGVNQIVLSIFNEIKSETV